MLSERIENILNEQINKEFYSAYLYLAMSGFFDEAGLHGMAHWTKVQAREEVDHGMIIFDHIIERNGEVKLAQINAPDLKFSSPLEAFTAVYEHEKTVTASIDAIASKTENDCDFATRNFINWYVKEQIEEEAQTFEIVSKLKNFADSKCALYHIDSELGKREYAPPRF